MLLFIFESIGTQELILIGIIALIFLGPRKLPEYSRKIGKMMAEFRGTASEFRQTWEREVNFEEETKALRVDAIDEEVKTPVARARPELPGESANSIAAPAVRQIDPSEFDDIHREPPPATTEPAENARTDDPLEKHNWL